MPFPIAAITTGASLLGSLLGGKKKDKGSDLMSLIAPGLTEGGMGLIGSILSGIGKQQELKQQFEIYKKKGTEQEKRMLKYLKPQLPRYSMEKDLPTLDPVFKKLVMGSLMDRVGGERLGRYGIDPTSILGMLGGQQQTLGTGGNFGGVQIPEQLANNIMSKYGGGHIGKRTEMATRPEEEM